MIFVIGTESDAISFAKDGRTVYLNGEPGSDEFNEAYADALAGKTEKSAPKKPTDNSSLDWLIRKYYVHISDLEGSTQRTYKSVLGHLQLNYGSLPAKKMNKAFVKRKMENMTPGAANKFLRMIRQLYNWGMSEGHVDSNPAHGIKKRKVKDGGFIEWTEDDIQQFCDYWPEGSKARLVMMLTLYLGQRRQSIPILQWNHQKGKKIRVWQNKSKKTIWIKVHPDLQAELNRHEKRGLFIVLTEYNLPFTVAGIGNWFGDRCREAGLPLGYNFHGLRKAQGRRLADGGATAHQIMSVLGHTTLKEAERYTRGADQKRLAAEGIDLISVQNKKRK